MDHDMRFRRHPKVMSSDGETIRNRVLAATAERPRHLNSIYRFVLRFRPGTAEQTIRARVYEAMEHGLIRRLAPGIYFARHGPASLLLVHGDARKVLQSLDDEVLDAIITDPPYDLGTRKHTMQGTTRPHQGKGRTYEQWDLDRQTLAQMFRVLRKDHEWNTINTNARAQGKFPRGGGALFLFVPPMARSTWRHIVALIELAESLGFVFWGSLTWDHEIIGMGYDCGRNRKSDVLLLTAGPRNGLLWDLSLPNVIAHRRLARRQGEHEAEKPVSLFLRLAKAVTRKGDVVADLFVGRGRWVRPLLAEGRHVLAVDQDSRWIARIAADAATPSVLGAQ